MLIDVQENGMTWPEKVLAFIQRQEAAFWDPAWVATAEWKMQDIMQTPCEFPRYYVEFLVIAADLDCNPSGHSKLFEDGIVQ